MKARVWRVVAVVVAFLEGSSGVAADDFSCRRLYANLGWQQTSLEIATGDAVCVSGRGVWSHGPETGGIVPFHGAEGYIGKPDEPAIVPWPFARIGMLLARIGEEGIAFPIDRELCFIAQTAGELMLSMNDLPEGFADNAGSLRIGLAKGDARHLERLASAHLDRLRFCLR